MNCLVGRTFRSPVLGSIFMRPKNHFALLQNAKCNLCSRRINSLPVTVLSSIFMRPIKKFALIQTENSSYAFDNNLFGCRMCRLPVRTIFTVSAKDQFYINTNRKVLLFSLH